MQRAIAITKSYDEGCSTKTWSPHDLTTKRRQYSLERGGNTTSDEQHWQSHHSILSIARSDGKIARCMLLLACIEVVLLSGTAVAPAPRVLHHEDCGSQMQYLDDIVIVYRLSMHLKIRSTALANQSQSPHQCMQFTRTSSTMPCKCITLSPFWYHVTISPPYRTVISVCPSCPVASLASCVKDSDPSPGASAGLSACWSASSSC